ncbi:MAG: NAD(P)H-binding protein [Moraxellaceae bacterium]|nr:NAD(P)H-binding protein [Moraxellaceae bacterium]
MAGETAILIGATGLVGGHCLRELLASPAYDKVIAVTRRPLKLRHEKLQTIEIPFDQLGEALADIKADDAFCCLGTTIRQAGTKAEFHKVDYGYAYEFAHRMQANGAGHFLLVSALGARAGSPVFYNRVKGTLENDIRSLGFSCLTIFQPSFLLGDRAEARIGEALGARLSTLIAPLLRGPLRAAHPVKGADLAAAMVAAALSGGKGVRICRYNQIQALIA